MFLVVVANYLNSWQLRRIFLLHSVFFIKIFERRDNISMFVHEKDLLQNGEAKRAEKSALKYIYLSLQHVTSN